MPDFLRPIKYFSDGYTYFVSQGLGIPDGPWLTVCVMSGKTAMYRVCSPMLKIRTKRDDAQSDLNSYAVKHNMTEIEED